jgi:NAD(P)H-hydrate repair Nnr-like enzyme with NAD(P)H-hydrate epimerase domain
LSLLIGAVTKASIFPAAKSAVAASRDSKANLPPFSVDLPTGILAASCQHSIKFGF